MCKRYSFTILKEAVENKFDLQISGNLKTSYNIAPTQHAYVITNENKNKLQYITWGLIPHWSRDGVNNGKLINARKEGIAASTSFRIPIRRQRCLVLADSYYDWKRKGQEEYPHRIVQDGTNIMVMAGVWDIWKQGDYSIKSFSIITIPAPKNLKQINERIPLVLETPKLQTEWLSDLDLNATLDIMSSKPTQLKSYPISNMINSIKFNSVELHEEKAS